MVDSGCTMSCHPVADDLINHRSSNELIMVGIDGIRRNVLRLVGDLPVIARDAKGKLHRLLLRDVRCVPEFTDSLISVDQIFESNGAEARFGSHRKIYVPTKSGTKLSFPFEKASDGLYIWKTLSPLHGKSRNLDTSSDGQKTLSPRTFLALAAKEHGFDVADFHRPKSSSFLKAMNSTDLASRLHHSLHLSPNIISRLPSLSRHVPRGVASAHGATCPHCVEANAKREAHSSSNVYKPSYAGRLIHADIVGPFKMSAIGRYRYALVLVDDHTRYKFVHFLKAKSEAVQKIRTFFATLNAHLNRGRSEPIKIVGSLHTDNAGEFLSKEFKDFIDSELIAQTTCPPHVHSLNGVAERAIRSIMENARAHMVSSSCPKSVSGLYTRSSTQSRC